MRRLIAAMAALAVLAGCGPRVHIVRDPNDLEEMNLAVTDLHATLKMKDGESVTCDRLLVGLDSTTWVDRQSGEVSSASTSSLVSVEVDKRVVGSVVGCLIGGLGGSVAAAADDAADDTGLRSAFAIAGGGLVGLMASAVRRIHEYRLEFSQELLERSDPSEDLKYVPGEGERPVRTTPPN